MKSFNNHESFFSSLTQLENRLSSENQTQQNQNEPINSISPSSSHLFLSYTTQKPTNRNTNTANSSDPPFDFLSNSPNDFKSENPNKETDDAEELMGLLNFSSPSRNPQKCGSFSLSAAISSCDDGFYRNVVGVKGPICKKEMKRLDGWIDLYRKEKREPARLAHLMIAKAVVDFKSCEFYGVEFPETVNEFLDVDPLAAEHES